MAPDTEQPGAGGSDLASQLSTTVNVDIGGTFTDCFVTYDGQVAWGKQPTTRHRLSLGFMDAVEEAAEGLGLGIEHLLKETDIVRYATTLAMNALIERQGPKLGLISTAGFEDTVFIGRGAQWHDALPIERKRLVSRGRRPEPLIPRDMVVGVSERVGANGEVVFPLDREEVRRKVRQLVDRGAMGFVVAMNFSHLNPVHEELVRDVILEEFPEVYLGSQPVLLSSEVIPKRGEYQRDMTAILSAYLHRTFAEELTELSARLREQGYERSLFLVNNAGGCNPLERTSAVQTYNAGPVAAVSGSMHMARLYGFRNAIMTDMGGTSFDIGTVVDVTGGVENTAGSQFFAHNPMIDRFRVSISMVETKSIGAGGGSIARYNDLLGIVEVGPQSAGANPGPACFDLGGEEPTVTDADVVLGYLNPERFLGGEMPLNAERAKESMDRVATPLGVSREEAAWTIKEIVDAKMGNEIYKETNLRGHDPREFTLFSMGGAGPTHACRYSAFVQSPRIVTFPFSSVFSAFGIANSDFTRTHEQSTTMRLLTPVEGEWLDEYDAFNGVVRELQQEALRDLEDLGAPEVRWQLELEMRYGMQPHVTRIPSPRLFVESEEDVREVHDAFEAEYSRIYSQAATYPEGGVEIVGFILWSVVPTRKVVLEPAPEESSDPGDASTGRRPLFLGPEVGWVEARCYDASAVRPGNRIDGPAVLEANDTTIVVESDWQLSVDSYGNLQMERFG